MAGDVGHPQRPGVIERQAEQAVPFGPVMDPLDLVLAQADRDELGQSLALADDAEVVNPTAPELTPEQAAEQELLEQNKLL